MALADDEQNERAGPNGSALFFVPPDEQAPLSKPAKTKKPSFATVLVLCYFSLKDVLVKSRLTGPAAGTGVQCFYNHLELLDSGWSLSRWQSGPE